MNTMYWRGVTPEGTIGVQVTPAPSDSMNGGMGGPNNRIWVKREQIKSASLTCKRVQEPLRKHWGWSKHSLWHGFNYGSVHQVDTHKS